MFSLINRLEVNGPLIHYTGLLLPFNNSKCNPEQHNLRWKDCTHPLLTTTGHLQYLLHTIYGKTFEGKFIHIFQFYIQPCKLPTFYYIWKAISPQATIPTNGEFSMQPQKFIPFCIQYEQVPNTSWPVWQMCQTDDDALEASGRQVSFQWRS